MRFSFQFPLLNSVIPLRYLKKNTLYSIATKDPCPPEAKTPQDIVMFRCRVHPYFTKSVTLQTIYFPPELVDEAFDASYFMFRGVNDIQFVNIICNDSDLWSETHFSLAWWERPLTSDEHVIMCSHSSRSCAGSSSRKKFCEQCGEKRHIPRRRGCSPRTPEHQVFCSMCGKLKKECKICGISCKKLDAYRIMAKIHMRDMQNNGKPAGGENLLRIIDAENVYTHRAMVHWIVNQCPCKDTDSRSHHPCDEFDPTCFDCLLRGEFE